MCVGSRDAFPPAALPGREARGWPRQARLPAKDEISAINQTPLPFSDFPRRGVVAPDRAAARSRGKNAENMKKKRSARDLLNFRLRGSPAGRGGAYRPQIRPSRSLFVTRASHIARYRSVRTNRITPRIAAASPGCCLGTARHGLPAGRTDVHACVCLSARSRYLVFPRCGGHAALRTTSTTPHCQGDDTPVERENHLLVIMMSKNLSSF